AKVLESALLAGQYRIRRTGCRVLSLRRLAGAGEDAARLRRFHHSAGYLVHHLGRHPRPRNFSADALGQYPLSGLWRGDRECHRNYRCQHAAHSTALTRQRAARAACPRDSVLHFRGVEHRRRADPARRPTVVSWISPRRAIPVDAEAVAAVALHSWLGAGGVL